MTDPLVKGWCPGALRPMESGDGLVLRIRPRGGRLTVEQTRVLADLALTHGSGLIDLGTRAHLQLRGIRADSLPVLHRVLADLDLLDPDPLAEARRNILTTPVWHDDETQALIVALERALVDAPDLPPKFGFAMDTGARAVLGRDSADIRIERAAHGLILRADGMDTGEAVSLSDAAPRAVALAHWFARNRGTETRMARLVAAGVTPPLEAKIPPLTGPRLMPGPTPFGLCLALPFGQITAQTLCEVALASLRLTPWRSVLIEGLQAHAVPPGLIADPSDPLLRVAACTGAPGCASAKASTRGLARALAPLVPEGAVLHVSGCAKGCAMPRAARLTLTATENGFDLISDGRAHDTPIARGLAPPDIPFLLRGHFASHL